MRLKKGPNLDVNANTKLAVYEPEEGRVMWFQTAKKKWVAMRRERPEKSLPYVQWGEGARRLE